MPGQIIIRRFKDVKDMPGVLDGIDAVFFQSSNTQTFADAAARTAFRERWLGRYLSHDPDWAWSQVWMIQHARHVLPTSDILLSSKS
jgi:hypothetical protein